MINKADIETLAADWPQPNEKRIALYPTSAAVRAVKSGHPWLFETGIEKQSHAGKAGDLAILFDRKKRFIGAGLLDPDSPIRIKILHQGSPAKIDAGWYYDKVVAAVQKRAFLPGEETDGYRVIHGENDGLPGLIVDRYAENLVIKLYSTAWIPNLKPILLALVDLLSPERLILRLSRHLIRKQLPAPFDNEQLLLGSPLPKLVQFKENGLLFEADLLKGQKTGFFLDQRENRARVRKMADGKTVLNLFAYTGAFSLYAAAGGATTVTSVDISTPALRTAEKIFALNQELPAVANSQHETVQGDAFDIMNKMAKKGMQFDIVVIDPPSFAKSSDEIPAALAAYQKLILLGLPLVKQNGVLVAASCSSRISAEKFFAVIDDTADRSGYSLSTIDRSFHAADHPVSFPEGNYLKCLFTQVKPW